MTKQKEAILGIVCTLRSHPTADEVYGKLRKEIPNISLGTIYRNLNQLADNGDIQRVIMPNGADRYDFRIDQHQHLKCVKCAKIYDIEAKVDIALSDSRFEVESYTLVLNGVCKNCKKKGLSL